MVNKIKETLRLAKKYWYIFLLIGTGLLAVVLGIVFKEKSRALVNAMMSNREGLLKQINAIEKLQEKKEAKEKQVEKEHEKEIELVEEKHEETIIKIEEEKKEKLSELEKKSSEDLAKSLKDEFDL